MKTTLSYRALDNMTVLRKSLKEFRVSNKYFLDHMYEYIIDHDDEIFGFGEITVKLDSGKEIPVIIDESIDKYKVLYVE